MLTDVRRPIDDDEIAIGLAIFLHRHCIGPIRNLSAGKNARRAARRQRLGHITGGDTLAYR